MFGRTLAAGDFNADGKDELAISADDYIHGSGRVLVLAGSSAGVTTTGAPALDAGKRRRAGQGRGRRPLRRGALCANFGRSAVEDLAIGVPGENQSRGVVDVLYGRASGLGSVNAQGWSQSTTGVKGTAAPDDIFGGIPTTRRPARLRHAGYPATTAPSWLRIRAVAPQTESPSTSYAAVAERPVADRPLDDLDRGVRAGSASTGGSTIRATSAGEATRTGRRCRDGDDRA